MASPAAAEPADDPAAAPDDGGHEEEDDDAPLAELIARPRGAAAGAQWPAVQGTFVICGI